MSSTIKSEKIKTTYLLTMGKYKIRVVFNHSDKKLYISHPDNNGARQEREYVFWGSKPEVVEAIGKLLIKASKVHEETGAKK